MENVNNEEIVFDSQTANAEKESVGENESKVSLGKFKDVESLLSAYNSLQSEFTKRCQRLKELEGVVNNKEETQKEEIPIATSGESLEGAQKSITEEDKENILKDYLKGVLGTKQKAVILDNEGVGVKAPSSKPKTISEAGMLAKEIF